MAGFINDAIEQSIRALADKDGRVRAEDFMAASRDPRHPAHVQFLWDDEAKAAHQWRLNLAKSLIGMVRIKVTVREIPVPVRAFVRDTEGDGDRYRDILQVRSDKDLSRDTLLCEMQRVVAAATRAERISAVLGSVGAAADLQEIRCLAKRVIQHINP